MIVWAWTPWDVLYAFLALLVLGLYVSMWWEKRKADKK